MIRYYLSNPDWTLERATDGSSGYDLRADLGAAREINPGERWLIGTGLRLEMPVGIEAQVRSRSGMAIHHGVIVLNAPGTIDSDYRGEIKVSLLNTSRPGASPYVVHPGDRIAQLVFAPVLVPNMDEKLLYSMATEEYAPHRAASESELSDTVRGSGGHGSTGR